MKSRILFAIGFIVASSLSAQEGRHSFVAGLGEMKATRGAAGMGGFFAYQRSDIFFTDKLNAQVGLTGDFDRNQVYHVAVGKSVSLNSWSINFQAGPSVVFRQDDINDVLPGGYASIQNSLRLTASWDVGIQAFYNYAESVNLYGGHLFLKYKLSDR
jgi:hypothetical protein